MEIVKKFKNRWNSSDNTNEYKPEKIMNARQLISELCSPWVEEKKPDLLSSISDLFLDDVVMKFCHKWLFIIKKFIIKIKFFQIR